MKMAKTVTITIISEGNLTAIPVPFDPVEVFGKVRAPVRVTLKGYSYRSTISRMQGRTFIPLRKSHREAAGVEGGEEVSVRIEADDQERRVEIPVLLEEVLARRPALRARWEALSYTNRRECAESITGARRADTQERRLAKVIELLEQQV